MPAVVGSIVPTVTGAGVFATDGGGWIAHPTASGCGIFHLCVGRGTDATSVPLAETFTEPLTPGSHDLALIGTDGNGPGTIQRLELSVTDSGGAAADLFPEASPGDPYSHGVQNHTTRVATVDTSVVGDDAFVPFTI